MDQVQLEKAWQGKATATLPHTTADAAWSLLSTFSTFHRWLPSVHTCRLIAGTDGQPGCVRYCASAPADDGKQLLWANEELLHVDAGGRSYRYRVADNNMGLERYEATLSAVPLPDGEGGAGSCQLEWRYESDPVQGWTEEGFAAYLQAGVAAMAERVEEALRAPPPSMEKCDAVDVAN
ncbi:lachrymatory-factor synthase-like [Curcuma longa]|uniref:lachrymatory-factor synthase-like n=1 Tax=Curcuma longa TaxID=136217 RepID=UPI003D9E4FB7